MKQKMFKLQKLYLWWTKKMPNLKKSLIYDEKERCLIFKSFTKFKAEKLICEIASMIMTTTKG